MHGYKWPINCTRTRSSASCTAERDGDADPVSSSVFFSRRACRAAGGTAECRNSGGRGRDLGSGDTAENAAVQGLGSGRVHAGWAIGLWFRPFPEVSVVGTTFLQYPFLCGAMYPIVLRLSLSLSLSRSLALALTLSVRSLDLP